MSNSTERNTTRPELHSGVAVAEAAEFIVVFFDFIRGLLWFICVCVCVCVCVLFWRWWRPCVPVKSAHSEPFWPSPLSLLIQTSCSPSLLFSLAPFVPPPLHLSLCLLSFVHKPRPRLKVKWTPTHPACLSCIYLYIYIYFFFSRRSQMTTCSPTRHWKKKKKKAHICRQISSCCKDQVQNQNTNLTMTDEQSNVSVGIGGRGHVQRDDTVLPAAHRLLVCWE